VGECVSVGECGVRGGGISGARGSVSEWEINASVQILSNFGVE